MVARTMAWLEAQFVRDDDGLHVDAFGSPVWCTAANVRALWPPARRRAIRAWSARSTGWSESNLSSSSPRSTTATRARRASAGGPSSRERDDGRQRRHGRGRDRFRRGPGRRRAEPTSAGGSGPRSSSVATGCSACRTRTCGWLPCAHAPAPGTAVLRPGRGDAEDPVGRGSGPLGPPRELGDSCHRGPGRSSPRRPRPHRADHPVARRTARGRVPAGPAVRSRRFWELDRSTTWPRPPRAPGTRARRRRHVGAAGCGGPSSSRPRGRTPTAGGASCPTPMAPGARRPRPKHAAAHRAVLNRVARCRRGRFSTPCGARVRLPARACSAPTGAGRTATGCRRSCRRIPSTSWPRPPSTTQPRRSPAFWGMASSRDARRYTMTTSHGEGFLVLIILLGSD